MLNVMGVEPIFAAMATSAYSLMNIFLSPFIGRYIGKAGSARTVHTIGMVFRIVVMLTLMLALSPSFPVWIVIVIMGIAGFYASVQNSVSSAGPMIQIRPEIRLQANSVVQIALTFGSTVSMAVITFIMASRGIAQGMPLAMGLAASSAAISLVIGLFLQKLPNKD
jgi:MFS family permease